jgi:hypothetical protein
MIEGPICQEEVFRHIRTGGTYVVSNGTHITHSDGAMSVTKTILKVGSAGPKEGWVHAITYYDPMDGAVTFVRDEETFRKSFERVT